MMFAWYRKSTRAKLLSYLNASAPKVKLSISKVVILFALLNSFSYYAGSIKRAFRDHVIEQSSSRSACGLDFTNRPSTVEFLSCREHHADRGRNTSHLMIDSYETKGISGSKHVENIVSWDEKIVHNKNEIYEAMVHPALLVHDKPRRILVLNDITGSILREVLKHSMVEEVIYIVPNAETFSLARLYLSEWNDCRLFLTDVTSCYDDSRVQIVFSDDPIKWVQKHDSEVVDVIFADSVTYPNLVDQSHFSSIYRVLGACGILVMHAATIEAIEGLPTWSQNAADLAHKKVWSIIDQHLFGIGFTNVVDYAEGRENFLLVMKCSQTRSNWMWNEAEWNLKIHQRLVESNRSSIVSFIDGATIMPYQFPSRTVEELWCRKDPYAGTNTSSCGNGHGFDPEIANTASSAVVVQQSIAVNGGRGVFTTQPIAQDSTISLGTCVEGIHVPSSTLQTLIDGYHKMEEADISDFWDATYLGFIDGYGWIAEDFGGRPVAGIDTDIGTFANHGCNGTYNVGPIYTLNEMNLVMEHSEPQNLYEKLYAGSAQYSSRLDMFYNPYNDRHYPMWSCQDERTNRKIEAGEELLYNYLGFAGTGDANWMEMIGDLQKWCSGGIGFVAQYDMSKDDFV